ncbi:MAG: protein of unknown function, putative recB domain, partial [Acidimicrobiaceae bacterium]|nr:protein of unknown function, putative recB domain [Acidimicrobiaceae bacterium]
RGLEHEAAYLAALEREGLDVLAIDDGIALIERVRATLLALAAGPDVIYQATFLDTSGSGPIWRGHADFLRRVDEPSALGAYSYEPEDTKLARHVRPSAVLQLCSYAEQLQLAQGIAPREIHVVLGGALRVSLRLAGFAAYYRFAKARFEAAIAKGIDAYPVPVAHCAICSWRTSCDEQRRVDDHLSLVAGLRADQVAKLEAAGVRTVAALGALGDESVPGLSRSTLDKLRDQARLQVAARDDPGKPPPYELLRTSDPGRGLGALPAPSGGDLFFDIEGDPFVGAGGLEYLLGVGWVDHDANFAYRAFWAHGPEEEKAAFEEFIDFVATRRQLDPELHVYHFAPYEPSALGRLMGRYGTREDELDDMLRAGVFVDLLQVVRQSVRIGTPSYGLKKLESLYMTTRTDSITDAGSSIVEYERYLESGEQVILDELERYNRVDCDSTRQLRDWLELRRIDYAAQFGKSPPRMALRDGDPSEDAVVIVAENVELKMALAAHSSGEQDAADASWLLGELLDWHRREDKPEWWRYFDRVLRCEEDDLYADTEAVAGLEYEGRVGQVARSAIHRYRFDPAQENKLRPGSSWTDPATAREQLLGGDNVPGPGTVVSVDPQEGFLELKRELTSAAPHPRCLIPGGPLKTPQQREALRRVARSTVATGIDGDGPYRAVRDLLLRRPPRLGLSAPAGPLKWPGELARDAVMRIACSLDGGCLAVQGPPGSGKTSTAALTILALVDQGATIGITANSHAVITNLVKETVRLAEKAGRQLAISQKCDAGEGLDHPWVTRRTTNEQMAADIESADILAGTAWLFSRPEFDQQLDFLVVDEAGQLSLANVAAVGTSARNLLLVGDPRQLAQPSLGTHPPGADSSALGHVLGDAETIPGDLGIFLDMTHRLHPSITRFISEIVYDGRLESEPDCERQAVSGGGPLSGSGLRFVPVEHRGNRTSSLEEVAVVKRCVEQLVGRTWTERGGGSRPLDLDDILVVAPYNAQVNLLRSALPPGVRVGTVDRFQGQEAPVVIISLAASSAEDVPRGMEFLYSLNRLNVAVSRAKGLAVLVCAPALLAAPCNSVEQLRLVNALCRYVELAVTVEVP